MYAQRYIRTKRLGTAYYEAGDEQAPKLLLLHGNLSSAVFYLPLFPYLTQWFHLLAPDLRCFGDTEDLPIDATRGYRDWSDDVASLLDELKWERFSIVGWSMGGNVAMQYVIDHGGQVDKLVLIAPGSPFGFGGSQDEKGTPRVPLGLGSGGGCVNPMLTAAKTRPMLRQVLNHLYFKPPFRMNQAWEDRLIDGIAKTKTGNGRYPGSYRWTWQWPFVLPGDKGVLNAMTPNYGRLSHLTEVETKPPILWIRGRDDILVSDRSMFELGYLGSIGMVPGWPGDRWFPPQPMVAQTRYILQQYQEKGGSFQELVVPGGHMCFLESPRHVGTALCSFLLE